jgi:hypothetical protein
MGLLIYSVSTQIPGYATITFKYNSIPFVNLLSNGVSNAYNKSVNIRECTNIYIKVIKQGVTIK